MGRPPNIAQQRAVVNDLPLVADQDGQHAIFRGRQANLTSVARYRGGAQVDDDVSAPHSLALSCRGQGASENGTNSREQLVGSERLGQVVGGGQFRGPALV